MASINYKALSMACRRVLGNLYNPRVEGSKLFIYDTEGFELVLTTETSLNKTTNFYASQISHYMHEREKPVKKSCMRLYAVYHTHDTMRADELRGMINVPCELKDTLNGIRSYKVVESSSTRLVFKHYEISFKDQGLKKIAEKIIYELTDDEKQVIKQVSKEAICQPPWFKHIKSRYDFQRNPMNKQIHDMLPEPNEGHYHGVNLWLINSGLIMVLIDGIWVNINKQQLTDIAEGKIVVRDDLLSEIIMYMGISQNVAFSSKAKTVAKKAI